MIQLTPQEESDNDAKYDSIIRKPLLNRPITDVVSNNSGILLFYEIGDLVVRSKFMPSKWELFVPSAHAEMAPAPMMKDGYQLGVIVSSIPKLEHTESYPLCAVMIAGGINWKHRAEKNANNYDAAQYQTLQSEGFNLGEIFFYSVYQ